MKKSAVIVLFAFATLPFSACNNGNDQAAYMQTNKAEQNAREAEQAEEEFSQLAKQEDKGTEEKTTKKSAHKAAKKETKTAKNETTGTREPASVKHHETAAGQRTWTVQLGAFKVKENAQKLTAKLKEGGFPVMMRSKDDLYLVHLEPTPNKEEAQKWQTDLKLKSFDSTLTTKRD